MIGKTGRCISNGQQSTKTDHRLLPWSEGRPKVQSHTLTADLMARPFSNEWTNEDLPETFDRKPSTPTPTRTSISTFTNGRNSSPRKPNGNRNSPGPLWSAEDSCVQTRTDVIFPSRHFPSRPKAYILTLSACSERFTQHVADWENSLESFTEVIPKS